MERNFVVEISFRGKCINAFVRLHQLKNEVGYCVDYLAEGVDDIIPGRRVLVDSNRRSPIAYDHPEAGNLIEATIQSISAHLYSRE
jgi:hypothetical protein